MDRSRALANRLRRAADDLADVIEMVDPGSWNHLPGPGIWSVGKEAEHVAEAAVYHQWIVRLTIGQAIPSRRPTIERAALTTRLSPGDAGALVRQRTLEAERLLRALTDVQLDLPTRPGRAGDERLGVTIERVLIGHYEGHRRSIDGKLARG